MAETEGCPARDACPNKRQRIDADHRYPFPFAGAQVRRIIGLYLDVVQHLQLMLLLWSGGFHLEIVLENDDGTPTKADEALRILQELGIGPGLRDMVHKPWAPKF